MNESEDNLGEAAASWQLPADLHQLAQEAHGAYQSGDVRKAEGLYKMILTRDSCHVDALTNLGSIHLQKGEPEEAVRLMDLSLTIDPEQIQALINRGVALQALGRSQEAIHSYDRAVELNPDCPEAYNNRGNALQESLRYEEAVHNYQRAVALRPEYAQAYNNQGNAFQALGKYSEALSSYERAIASEPHYQLAYYNRGNVLRALKRYVAAVESYDRAIQLDPQHIQAHNNRGIVLHNLQRYADAVDSYDRAIESCPTYLEAHNNRGNALKEQGRYEAALHAFDRVLNLKPDYAEAHYNRAIVLHALKRFEEALAANDQALIFAPDSADAYNNKGYVFEEIGELDKAIAAYEMAIALKPDHHIAHSNRLYTMHFHPDYSPQRILLEHRQWYQQQAASLRPVSRAFERDLSPERRLRIGYVAPYFREHCQAFFLQPVLSHHDHQQFEIIAYSDVKQADAITQRLRGYCDGWRDTGNLSDEGLAQLIEADRIDILVDLSLHMADNRLLSFARKPAPLQVTWLGYPATTGLDTMDYRLTDPWLDPPQSDAHYVERSFRLPHTFWCYDPLSQQPPVNELPALRQGVITFGCLNNFCKVNAATLGRWGAVMRAVKDSKLRLLAPREARPRVLQVLAEAGIEEQRIHFQAHLPRPEYLASYHHIDLALETFPYNGHTTSLDAIWMGVPVISVAGTAAVGRAGWSLLNNLGLPALAAPTPEAYVDTVVAVAGDWPALAQLRASLRPRLQASPLMQGALFTTHLEHFYRTAWHRWVQERSLLE